MKVNTRKALRHLIGALCIIGISLAAVIGDCAAQEVSKPIVSAAIAPKSAKTTLAATASAMASAAPARGWQEGDPVIVREDLNRAGEVTAAAPAAAAPAADQLLAQ